MAKSILRLVRLNLFALFFTLVFITLFILTLTLFTPIYLFRFVASILSKLFRPDLGKLVTTRSVVIAGTDDPTHNPRWNLCVWIVLEGHCNFEQFRINFNNQIIQRKLPNGQLHSPEYQQYYYKWLGFLFWKWEKDFSLNEHMRHLFPSSPDQCVSEQVLQKELKRLTYEPFKPKKSPWEFLFVNNYQEDKSVLIFRTHHGFCDGFAILNLLMTELNANNITLDYVAKPEKVEIRILSRILQTLLFFIIGPYKFMKMVVRATDKNDWHLKKLNRPFNLDFTERISLDYIKEIKNIQKVSFSAVIYSSITGALRKAMIENGKKVPNYISTAVAVPMPGHPRKLRNHFIFSFLQLPIGMEDPLERLHKVERNIQRLKKSPVPLFSFGMIPIVGGTFVEMMKLFSNNPYSTVLTSNFPGPPITGDFIAGGGRNKVLDMNFSAGLGEGNVGIGFCMMSYGGAMRIISSFAPEILATDGMVKEFNKKILNEMEMLRGSIDFV